MKITVNFPTQFIDETMSQIMENYPEYSHGSALRCIGWDYKNIKYDFVDAEDRNKPYLVTRVKLRRAFKLLFSKAWPNGFSRPPISQDGEAWDHWLGNCDAEVTDAILQLALFGEIIYG